MKIQIESSALAKACALATKNIPNKVIIPIISNLLIEADGNSLKISSTDMETWVVQNVPATVKYSDIPESFCINAANMTSLLQAIPSQPVTIEVLQNKSTTPPTLYAKITHSMGVAELPVAYADEYPTLQPIQSAGCSLPADVLKHSIQMCRFCLFTDAEAKPELCCVLLDFKEKSMVAVGTNGNIMTRLEHPDIEGEKCRYLLPMKTLSLLVPALDDVIRSKEAIDVVMIRKNDNMSCVQTDLATIYFRQPERKYPNYDSVIPRKDLMQCEAVMNRQDLISSITRASLFTSAGSMKIVFHFDGYKDFVKICGQDIDFSTSSEEKVRCEFTEGKYLTIALKATLLKDLLSHLSSEQVRFSMIDHSRQVIITEEGGNPNVLMLIMPMILDL